MPSRAPWQLVIIEAMTAASGFIGEEIRKDFLIIGGAALLKYGSPRYTRDVDIAITAQTLDAFSKKASSDPRFSLQPNERWVYTAQGPGVEGLQVEFEFLSIEGEFVPKLHGMTKFDPIWVASLADIAVMKAHAFQDRSTENDYGDLLYTLREMKKRGQTLVGYKIKKSAIKIIQAAVAGDEEGETCLSEVIR